MHIFFSKIERFLQKIEVISFAPERLIHNFFLVFSSSSHIASACLNTRLFNPRGER